jgi:hypothetical protein
MATHTIGTGGDFSTPQAWEDDIPATLTEQRIGQLKNESFSGSPAINFSAHTTTASFDIILETESGASFKDQDVRNRALRFQTDSARLTSTGNYFEALRVGSVTIGHLIVRNIQFQKASGSYVGAIDIHGVTTTAMQFKDCIVESHSTNWAVIASALASGTLRFDNVVMINRSTGGHGLDARGSGGTTHVNHCTIVRPSNITAAGTGIRRQYGTTVVKNTLIAGFTTDIASGADSSSDYNATTFTDGGSGLPDPTPDHNVYNINYNTSLVVQPSDSGGNHDFRTVSGSALEDTGLLDSTNAPNDISGTARSDPPEIGAWELDAGAPGGGITATASLAFATAADIQATGKLSGTAAVAFTTAADVSATGKLSATATPAFTASGQLHSPGKLVAAPAIAFTGTADLSALGTLAATGAVSFTGAGDISAQGRLSGTAALQFATAAVLTEAGQQRIFATATLTFVTSAVLRATGKVQALAALSFATAADVSASGKLVASSAIAFTTSADLRQQNSMAAVAAMSISTAVVLEATGRLVAAGNLTWGASALLADANVGILGAISNPGAIPGSVRRGAVSSSVVRKAIRTP